MRFWIVAIVATALLIAGSANAQDEETVASAGTSTIGDGLAFVDIQRVATESDAGQAANVQVQELSQQKMSEIETKNTELQGTVTALNEQLQEQQQKLQQGQTVMSTDARLSLQREISRLQLDVQRTTQDAQAEAERLTQDAEVEVQALQQELQIEFQQKLVPVIEQVAADQRLSFIFSAGEGGLIWANTDLDLTQELIDLLNAQTGSAP